MNQKYHHFVSNWSLRDALGSHDLHAATQSMPRRVRTLSIPLKHLVTVIRQSQHKNRKIL
jgi:hypothetical protein